MTESRKDQQSASRDRDGQLRRLSTGRSMGRQSGREPNRRRGDTRGYRENDLGVRSVSIEQPDYLQCVRDKIARRAYTLFGRVATDVKGAAARLPRGCTGGSSPFGVLLCRWRWATAAGRVRRDGRPNAAP